MIKNKQYKIHINTGVGNYAQLIIAGSPKEAVHRFAYRLALRFNVKKSDLSRYILKNISTLDCGYENIGGYIYAAAVDVITGKIYEYKIACDLGDE